MNENVQDITHIIKTASPKKMQKMLSTYHPSDIAESFEQLPEDDQHHSLLALNHHILADMFSHINDKKAAKLFNKMDTPKVGRILATMDRDDATDILKLIDAEDRNQYLKNLDKESRNDLETLITYREETAGSIMTTDFIELRKGMDVKDAMKTLIKNAESTEGIQRLFVLDDNDFLEGVIELKALIQARSPKKIDDLMRTDIITVKENDETEEVARLIQNYGIYLLPVVNEQNQLKGVITMDDAADILDIETDEDYARFATISSEESVNRSIWRSAMHRLPWLTMLLVLGLVVSTIISQFEETIAQVTVLVFFQPLIMGMAGNTGTQSLAVTVRGISKNYYSDSQAARQHVLKELRVGLLNGLAIGLFSFVTTTLFLSVIQSIGMITLQHNLFIIAFTISLSTGIALILATMFGAMIPLTLNKLNIDPAVASGPFITTLNDILGLVVYFAIATIIILGIWGG